MKNKALIILFVHIILNQSFGYAQSKLRIDLNMVIDHLCLESPDAKMEYLKYQNELLVYKNYKKKFLPSLGTNLDLIDFNRSIKQLQDPTTGEYIYTDEFSSSSSIGLYINQKIGPLGGELSIRSDLNYLREFSQSKNNFSTIPFSINYTQKIRGGNRLFKYDLRINNLIDLSAVKKYCLSIANIQTQAARLFMNAAIAKLTVDMYCDNLNSMDSLLKISKIKYVNEKITEYNYKQIELQYLSIGASLQNSKDNYANQIIQLCTYLGINANQDIALDVMEFQVLSNITKDRRMYFIERDNPFVKELDLEQAQADKSLYSAKISNSFNGTINLSYGSNKYDDNFASSYIRPNSRQVATIAFQVPIFNWGINKNNYKMAKNSYESTIIGINKRKDQFYDDIMIKYNAYINSLNLYSLACKKKELAIDIYNTAVHKMALGKLSIYELSQVTNDQEAQIVEYYQSINDVWVSYFTLRAIALYDFYAEESLINKLTD